MLARRKVRGTLVKSPSLRSSREKEKPQSAAEEKGGRGGLAREYGGVTRRRERKEPPLGGEQYLSQNQTSAIGMIEHNLCLNP